MYLLLMLLCFGGGSFVDGVITFTDDCLFFVLISGRSISHIPVLREELQCQTAPGYLRGWLFWGGC